MIVQSALLILALCAIVYLIWLVHRTRAQLPRAGDPALFAPLLGTLEKSIERTESALRDELARNRKENADQFARLQQSVLLQLSESTRIAAENLRAQSESTLNRMKTLEVELSNSLRVQTDASRESLEKMRATIEAKLAEIQKNSNERLEKMQTIVDEKLQTTLEKRLGESFKLVSERLEAVHKGLGEMQVLATSVGDLKRVMGNVKTRGTWGEVQLGALLEQIFPADRYVRNWKPSRRQSQVEYAIRLPGTEEGQNVYLPIDAKFPTEDFQRLQIAADNADPAGVEESRKALINRVKSFAADIASKYLVPPESTDFGVLFLPSEGLYAELVRDPAVVDEIQRIHRVILAGPTTLLALLNSLQLGFRTLAIQKKSAEVWKVLSEVKLEFGKFESTIAAVHKKIKQAGEQLEDDVGVRTRALSRVLRTVETTPDSLIGEDPPLPLPAIEPEL